MLEHFSTTGIKWLEESVFSWVPPAYPISVLDAGPLELAYHSAGLFYRREFLEEGSDNRPGSTSLIIWSCSPHIENKAKKERSSIPLMVEIAFCFQVQSSRKLWLLMPFFFVTHMVCFVLFQTCCHLICGYFATQKTDAWAAGLLLTYTWRQPHAQYSSPPSLFSSETLCGNFE